jgi:glycosyltransferase involved in cell wall biosynthesis
MLTLSVIVPVYNTEEYLEDCIKSILKQSFKDFELIIVNDGSTDGSSAIINKYAATDSRIVVIDTVNKGVSNARNLGLRAAKGTYVGFVDSDDTIVPDMYQKLIDSIRANDSEMACCLIKQVIDRNLKTMHCRNGLKPVPLSVPLETARIMKSSYESPGKKRYVAGYNLSPILSLPVNQDRLFRRPT